jgi:type I restriction enzyme S subunit
MPSTLNGGVFVVRDLQKRVIPKYLMYYLTSYKFTNWVKSNHTQGSIQHLTQKLLEKFSIPLPSLSEQSRIVSILDKFEASIANLEEQLALRQKQYEYYREKLLTFD